jgi:hypothetical protein
LFDPQGTIKWELSPDNAQLTIQKENFNFSVTTDFSGRISVEGTFDFGPGANKAESYARLVLERTHDLIEEKSERFLDKMNSTNDASTAMSRVELFVNSIRGIVDGSMERLASADQLSNANLAALRREVESSLLVAAYQLEEYEELTDIAGELRQKSVRHVSAKKLIESIAKERGLSLP